MSETEGNGLSKNYRNGHLKKSVKTQLGKVDVNVPRDRNGEYEPKIIAKNKPSFTNDDSLRKMLYLASKKIVEHWTVSCRNWDMVLNQLNIVFADRISA